MDFSAIGGVWPATLTPFRPDGGIDGAALAAHIAGVAGTHGVKAVVVNGHAGEATSLDRAERAHVVRCAVEAAGEKVGVVAGIVADDTRGAVALAKDAEEAGAEALLLFPPAVFAQGADARPDMALRFVSTVAGATRLPIVLFQLSRASGLGYTTPVLAQLCAQVPSIVAVKEGSDIPEVYEDNVRALRALKRPVAILTTNNTWLLASLAYGADGILSGIGSVVPELLVQLHQAMAANDLSAARAVNDRLHPLCRAFYRRPYLDSHNRMKTALHILGRLPHPDPRLPLLPIEAGEAAAIRTALCAAGLMGGGVLDERVSAMAGLR